MAESTGLAGGSIVGLSTTGLINRGLTRFAADGGQRKPEAAAAET
jgi:hypothetical protein